MLNKPKLLSSITHAASSDIIAQLDLFLKHCRRKQSIFFKLSDLARNTAISKLDLQLHLSYLFKDFNLLLIEELELIRQIQNVGCSRSLLYTLFMRIMEILEQTKNRLKQKEVYSVIDQEKRALTDYYSHQIKSATYDIVPLVQIQSNSANIRIKRLFYQMNRLGIGKEVKLKPKQPESKQITKQTKPTRDVRQSGQFQRSTRDVSRRSQQLELTSKTVQIHCKTKTPSDSVVLSSKNQQKLLKVFNSLYRPIQARMQVIEPKSEMIKVKLQRLLQKNKWIQKDIGDYSLEYREKRKEFRIKLKLNAHSE